MKILLATNNQLDIAGTYSADTSTVRRDTNYSPYSFYTVSGQESYIENREPIKQPVGNTVWFHGHIGLSAAMVGSSTISRHFFSFRDINNNLLFEIHNLAAKFQIRIYGDTVVTSPSEDIGITVTSPVNYDIKCAVTSSLISVEFYNDGVLKLSLSASNTTSQRTNFRFFRLNYLNTSGTRLFASEIIIAEDSTIGARLKTLDLVANGFHNQWGGSVATINDEAIETAITTSLANQKQSYTLPTISNTGTVISSLVASFHGASGDSPNKARHLLRTGGVDYESSLLNLSSINKPYHINYEVNPVTGLAWTVAEINALEIGFKSEA